MPLTLSTVGVGTVAGDGTGDTAREGGIKINDNFSAIQTLVNSNETALSSKLANVVEDTTPELGGDLGAGGNNITNLGDVTFKTGAAGGTLRTGTSAADKFQLQAYDVDGAAYVTLLEADAGNDVRLQLLADHLDLEDATDPTKIAKFDASGITTGTSRTFAFPDASGTFMLNVSEDATPTLGGPLDAGGFDINNGGVVFLTEQAAAEADVAGKGQFWVKTETPNVAMFTDDAGTDFNLQKPTECMVIACSDETTALTTGVKVTFYMPYAMTLTDIKASCVTAPTGASLITDVHLAGTSIMTTDKLVIEASEFHTNDATTQPTLTTTALTLDGKIEIEIDQIGSTVAGAGLKVYLIGSRT